MGVNGSVSGKSWGRRRLTSCDGCLGDVCFLVLNLKRSRSSAWGTLRGFGPLMVRRVSYGPLDIRAAGGTPDGDLIVTLVGKDQSCRHKYMPR